MARQDDYVRYTVRIPAALYQKLVDAPGERSVNAEIVERLARSFDLDDELEGIEDRVSQLETQVADESREVDNRLDRIEANMWRLLEHAGMYDPNPD